MNILIVGNGFDLSHYLPTKYDHFMVAMNAIENWDESKGDMGFDDLLGSLYEKEDYFFGYTKAMYKTDEIKISIDQIKELKEKLKENVWYQYFSDHVREVKTWIDFEVKINEALNTLSVFLIDVKKAYDTTGDFKERIFIGKLIENQKYILTQRQFNILSVLGLFERNNNYGRAANNKYGKDLIAGNFSIHCFIVPNNGTLGFNYLKYLQMLQEHLENFINIFNLYLELVISQLTPVDKFSIENADWIYPDKIFSFNYTNTYERIYDSVEVEYLHGRHGVEQNIVLGVSDLEDESLKKIKAYGFTKYHQKLFKDTDYLFLDEYKKKVKSHKLRVEYFEKDFGDGDPIAKKHGRMELMEDKSKLNLNVSIWGHSLDISDQDYIKDLFSLNDDMDRTVRITVYYFDKNAKFSLLNNLLAILGKDKVEHWMKNKWLQFKENPKIVLENAINSED